MAAARSDWSAILPHGDAARHLLECQGLAPTIEDFGRFENHEAYCGRLSSEHGRKVSFLSLLEWQHYLRVRRPSRRPKHRPELRALRDIHV